MRELREICEDIRGEVKPDIENLRRYKWIGASNDQTLEFVKRAVVIRQYEAANAILALVDAGYGSSGVIMLRPAYEELLWIEYLDLCGEKALELVRHLTVGEIRKSYDAQKEFLGRKGIREIGFTAKLSKQIEHGFNNPTKELSNLGDQLGWRKGAPQPSVAFIARQVKREKQYRFLYQGTSRSVHFSPHELQRRVWGQHGSVEIGSNTFEGYWCDFAMSWSFRILLETMICSDFTAELEKKAVVSPNRLTDLIHELRPIQILTASELESWDEPKAKFRSKS